MRPSGDRMRPSQTRLLEQESADSRQVHHMELSGRGGNTRRPLNDGAEHFFRDFHAITGGGAQANESSIPGFMLSNATAASIAMPNSARTASRDEVLDDDFESFQSSFRSQLGDSTSRIGSLPAPRNRTPRSYDSVPATPYATLSREAEEPEDTVLLQARETMVARQARGKLPLPSEGKCPPPDIECVEPPLPEERRSTRCLAKRRLREPDLWLGTMVPSHDTLVEAEEIVLTCANCATHLRVNKSALLLRCSVCHKVTPVSAIRDYSPRIPMSMVASS